MKFFLLTSPVCLNKQLRILYKKVSIYLDWFYLCGKYDKGRQNKNSLNGGEIFLKILTPDSALGTPDSNPFYALLCASQPQPQSKPHGIVNDSNSEVGFCGLSSPLKIKPLTLPMILAQFNSPSNSTSALETWPTGCWTMTSMICVPTISFMVSVVRYSHLAQDSEE